MNIYLCIYLQKVTNFSGDPNTFRIRLSKQKKNVMDFVCLFFLCVHCKKGVLTAGIVNSFATKWGRRKMLTVLGGMGPHFWVSGLSALDVLRGVGLLWGWGIANSSVRLWFLGLVMANCHSTMALGPRLQPDDDDSIGALNFPVWTASLADSFPSPGIGNKIMAQSERNACRKLCNPCLQLPMHL